MPEYAYPRAVRVTVASQYHRNLSFMHSGDLEKSFPGTLETLKSHQQGVMYHPTFFFFLSVPYTMF